MKTKFSHKNKLLSQIQLGLRILKKQKNEYYKIKSKTMKILK